MKLGLLDQSAARDDQALQLASLLVIAAAVLLTLPALVPLGLPIEGDAVDYRVPLLLLFRHGNSRIFRGRWWTITRTLGELLMLPFFAVSASLARLVPLAGYLGLGVAGGVVAVTLDHGRSGLSRAALFWAGMAWALALRPLALQGNVLMTDNLASCFLIFATLFAIRGAAVPAGIAAACGLATRYNVWATMAVLPALVFYFSGGKQGNPFSFSARSR